MTHGRRSLYWNTYKKRTQDPLRAMASRVKYLAEYEHHFDKDKFRVCDYGFTKAQGWGGLYRAWQGFIINREKDDYEKMHVYAQSIQNIEKDMKIDIAKFPDLQMYALEYASDPENAETLEEEAAKIDKDVDELNSQEILGIMLAQDEKIYQSHHC